MGILDNLRQRLNPERPKALEPGLYSYTAPPSHPFNYRLHLRVEPGGEAILVVNASTVLHLNQTAAEYAYHFVSLTPPETVAESIAHRYRVSQKRAAEDYAAFAEKITTLIETPDLDPVTYLDLERHRPYTEALSAPYRLDCALTYRQPKGAPKEAAPHKRVDKELTTDEWKAVLDKAWDAGVPHAIFTGGEPTLRKDLVELLQHCEDKGMVTGLITDGLKLGDTKYLKSLLDAGLDHVMIVLQPRKKQTWESLASFGYWRDVLDDDIFVAAHLTLTQRNAKDANALLDRLAESGVSAVSLSENDPALTETLKAARDHADFIDLPQVWDLPVPYSDLNPVRLELENPPVEVEFAEQTPSSTARRAVESGAGKAWLYVEPDGDVLPGQGQANKVLGNLVNDDWEKVWGKAS